MKKRILYHIVLACGYLPMGVGLLIFFIWWAARAFYAVNLCKLERFGYLWALISLGLLFIGLILLIIFLVKNGKPALVKAALSLALLLLNLPLSRMILSKVAEIEEKAYVRIENKTGLDKLEINIYPYFSGKENVVLGKGKAKVFSYIPAHTQTDERSYTINPATLVAKDLAEKHRIVLPPIDRDECKRFLLDEYFMLKSKFE